MVEFLGSKKGLAFCLGLIVLSFIIWLIFFSQNPREKLFWQMVDKNLATNAVSRTSKIFQAPSASGSASMVSFLQLDFNKDPLAYSSTTIKGENNGKPTLTTIETIGVGGESYLRYKDFAATKTDGTAVDTSQFVGIWSKVGGNKTDPKNMINSFSLSLPQLILIGNLKDSDRQKIVNQLHQKDVYQIDFKNIKESQINGQTIVDFPVKVKRKAYTQVLDNYLQTLGYLGSGINLSVIQDSQIDSVNVRVNQQTGRLVSVLYPDREDIYSDYGVGFNQPIPEAKVSTDDLQAVVAKATAEK